MTSDELSILIDWDRLFSAHSIVLYGDPLSGVASLRDHIRRINPSAEITIVHDKNDTFLFEGAEVIIEVVQKVSGNQIQRLMIIQKWKGHDVPTNLIPFLIQPDKIEVDTKERVI